MTDDDLDLFVNSFSQKIRENLMIIAKKICNDTKDPKNHIDISEIELLGVDLTKKSNAIFSDFISCCIANIDEKNIVKSKKRV